jgi:LacI family transcriptional regulator
MNIYKIAELAGVSVTTVSKVLNGKKDIGAETRQRVLTIIEENNYRPKIFSTSMDTIGVFAPIGRDTHISNPYFSSILSGIGDVTFNYDVNISIIPLNKVPRDAKEFIRLCSQRRISGAIFCLLTIEDKFIGELAEKIPLVSIARYDGREGVCYVEADNFTGAYDAVTHLIKTGHKEIMTVLPTMKHIDHIDRLNGAMKALEEHGLHISEHNIDQSLKLSDSDLGYYIDRVLNSNKKPTAVFIASDQEAIRVMRVLQERNLHIPEDISIIGFDDLYFTANTNPPLTTVHQPINELGAEACKMIINMIENKEISGNITRKLKTRLMVRKSTANI